MIETHPQGEGPAAPGWRTPASPAKGSPQRDLVLWPARLSHTSNTRSGGRSSGKVKGIGRPFCHTCHRVRFRPGSIGSVMVDSLAVTSSSVILSQGCKIAFVLRVTGWSCTCPVAGWNRVRILAVPARTYSCGCVAGQPFSCQLKPGCGTVWNGPASSSHQTDSPSCDPSV